MPSQVLYSNGSDPSLVYGTDIIVLTKKELHTERKNTLIFTFHAVPKGILLTLKPLVGFTSLAGRHYSGQVVGLHRRSQLKLLFLFVHVKESHKLYLSI